MPADIKTFLEEAVVRYNRPEFIAKDPICVPHQCTRLQDIEIMGFWTAMLAWGQRKTIIQSGKTLWQCMDKAPHDFMVNHIEADRKRFLDFRHRTFQPTDTLYFLEFFQQYYQQHHSLEDAFLPPNAPFDTVEQALIRFHERFFALSDAPARTRKHIPTPLRHSTCKRLNMFLRWMVRRDAQGVDFGLWHRISPAQLLIPLDVHVDRVARRLGLLQRTRTDWQAVLELSETLRQFDPDDPVKYDFALFGLGVLEPSGN